MILSDWVRWATFSIFDTFSLCCPIVFASIHRFLRIGNSRFTRKWEVQLNSRICRFVNHASPIRAGCWWGLEWDWAEPVNVHATLSHSLLLLLPFYALRAWKLWIERDLIQFCSITLGHILLEGGFALQLSYESEGSEMLSWTIIRMIRFFWSSIFEFMIRVSTFETIKTFIEQM